MTTALVTVVTPLGKILEAFLSQGTRGVGSWFCWTSGMSVRSVEQSAWLLCAAHHDLFLVSYCVGETDAGCDPALALR